MLRACGLAPAAGARPVSRVAAGPAAQAARAASRSTGDQGPGRPSPAAGDHRPFRPHDGDDHRHEHNGEQGQPGRAQVPPPRRPDRGPGHHPYRLEGHRGDDHRHQMPQADGHRRLVQARYAPPQAGPGKQPGGGRLCRQDNPGLGGGAGEQRDRRVGVARGPPCRPGTPGTSPGRPSGPRRPRPARTGATRHGSGCRRPRRSPTGGPSPTPAGSRRTRARAGAARSRPHRPRRPPQPSRRALPGPTAGAR